MSKELSGEHKEWLGGDDPKGQQAREIERGAHQETGAEQEVNGETAPDQNVGKNSDEIEKLRQEISDSAKVVPPTIFEQYQKDCDSFVISERERKSPWRRLLRRLNTGKASKLYAEYPQVAEGNNPESENYYLKQVDRYNEQQEKRAEELGFDKRIAFISHVHSRGVENWKDGSDGSLSPKEIFEEYKKAVAELKAQGIDQVFIAITDHQGVGNSLKLAEMLEAEGIAKPIVGIEVANNEGYENVAYTTDLEKLKDFYKFLEKRRSRLMRYGKTGYSGKEIIARLAEDDFVIGLSHPSAKKTITMGGAIIDRMESDPEFRAMIRDNVVFYEAINWFQNTSGSNCLSVSMMENMEKMGVLPFNGEDFHSKVSGSESHFLNSSMYNEIRTDQDIKSGEDLLELLRSKKRDPDHPRFVNMLRGRPALAEQYNEHINNAAARVVPDTLKAIVDRS